MIDRDPTDLGLPVLPTQPPPPARTQGNAPRQRVRRCPHGTPGHRAVDGTPVCPRCWAIENGRRR